MICEFINVLVAPVSKAKRTIMSPAGPNKRTGTMIKPWLGSKPKVITRSRCLWGDVQRKEWRNGPALARAPCGKPHRDPCYATTRSRELPLGTRLRQDHR